MITKKVCILGSSAVGKTSLVRRAVYRVFSEKYLTTIGVKVDRKTVSIGAQEVGLVLWDIQGDDEFSHILPTYLRGASGCLMVADGTRGYTIEKALDIAHQVEATVGAVPSILILNKSDLVDEWEAEAKDIDALRHKGWSVVTTSAKLGQGVEEAFIELTKGMLHA